MTILILLLLSSGDVIFFGLSLLLLADTVEPLVSARLSDRLVGLERLHVVRDLHGPDPADGLLEWHDAVAQQLGSLLHVLLGGITLPGLASLDGEQDQLGLVLLQSLHIQLESLHALVATAGVHADANRLGLQK